MIRAPLIISSPSFTMSEMRSLPMSTHRINRDTFEGCETVCKSAAPFRAQSSSLLRPREADTKGIKATVTGFLQVQSVWPRLYPKHMSSSLCTHTPCSGSPDTQTHANRPLIRPTMLAVFVRRFQLLTQKPPSSETVFFEPARRQHLGRQEECLMPGSPCPFAGLHVMRCRFVCLQVCALV